MIICGLIFNILFANPCLILGKIYKALENLDEAPGPDCWYVGDSTTDTISAKEAGITNVFFNGAQWDQAWLDNIFPGTEKHPHIPDAVVNNNNEFMQLVRSCLPDRN